jgi:glycosyltransferase involved in cell wall biosynthesis
MKICFLSSKHTPNDKRIFYKEAISLVKAGFEVIHIAPSEEQSSDKCGVQIITYPCPQGDIERLLQIPRLFRLAIKVDADFYHCNEVDSWFVGVLLKLFHRKKIAFDVHEHYPSTFAESRFPKWIRPAVSWTIRMVFSALLLFTDRIVFAKKSVKPDFKSRSDKQFLVQNFTPLSGLNFTVDERKTKLPGEELVVVHLGLFGKLRGWPQFLAALGLAKNKKIRFIVIGEFNDGTRAEFIAAVQRADLEERVKIHDWMPFTEAFQFLCQADIGLIVFQPGTLNHVYALPHKMFDYMAAGNAVLCPYFATEIAHIVEDTGCGLLIDTADPVDIAKKLDYLASSPERIVQMGIQGKIAVRDTFNWEREAEKLIGMYKQLENEV